MHGCFQRRQLESITNTDCAEEVISECLSTVFTSRTWLHSPTYESLNFNIPHWSLEFGPRISEEFQITQFSLRAPHPKRATCTDISLRTLLKLWVWWWYDGYKLQQSIINITEVPVIIGKSLLKAVIAFMWQLPRVLNKKLPLAPWLSLQLS